MVPLANVLLMYCNVVSGPCFSGQKLPLTVIVFRAAMVACLVNHSFFSEQLTVYDNHDLQTMKSAQIRIKACKEEEIHRVCRMEASLQSDLLDNTIYQTKYRS